MAITIYKADSSAPARAVLMTVDLLGLTNKVDFIDLNLQNNEQITPEFMKKNPQHTVPLLEDGDFVVADSHVIITYLVSKYGGDLRANLYPDDLRKRATIDHRLYLDGTVLFPILLAIVKSILHDKTPGPNSKQREEVVNAYSFVEKHLEQAQCLGGDHFTVADVPTVSTISTLNVLVPINSEQFPKIIEWWNKLKSEKWYINANVPGLTQFESVIKTKMEQNVKIS